jgi:hypothetical protein
MNGTSREVLVSKFANQYCIQCYEPMNANPIHSWTTDNVLAIGVIIQLWIQFGHKESLMLQMLSDIL